MPPWNTGNFIARICRTSRTRPSVTHPAAPRAIAAVVNSSPQGAMRSVGPPQAKTATSPGFRSSTSRISSSYGFSPRAPNSVGVKSGASAAHERERLVERPHERAQRLVGISHLVHDVGENGGVERLQQLGRCHGWRPPVDDSVTIQVEILPVKRRALQRVTSAELSSRDHEPNCRARRGLPRALPAARAIIRMIRISVTFQYFVLTMSRGDAACFVPLGGAVARLAVESDLLKERGGATTQSEGGVIMSATKTRGVNRRQFLSLLGGSIAFPYVLERRSVARRRSRRQDHDDQGAALRGRGEIRGRDHRRLQEDQSGRRRRVHDLRLGQHERPAHRRIRLGLARQMSQYLVDLIYPAYAERGVLQDMTAWVNDPAWKSEHDAIQPVRLGSRQILEGDLGRAGARRRLQHLRQSRSPERGGRRRTPGTSPTPT